MNLLHDWAPPEVRLQDGVLTIMRGDRPDHRSGPKRGFRTGPNEVHAVVIHPDGSYDDCGVSYNLLTNTGRDWWADALGGIAATGGQGSPATATSATSFTATATPWTVNQLAGKVAVFPVTGITTTPVFGLIGSNTNAVATIDKWWTPDFAGTGTTPAATNAFQILPGRGAGVLFMGVTADAGAAAAGDATLASEITTNGMARAKATYAHTGGTATLTLANTYSVSGGTTTVHKMGLFTCSTVTAGGIMVYETVLNADAIVLSGDSLTVTWTGTLSG